jgi:hypothetical protein
MPLLLGGVALWVAMQHRAEDGWFTAPLAPMRTDGYAVVVPDVAGLVRREAPFTQVGQTTLRFAARTPEGPAFVGLAPRAAVERYLAGVPYGAVTDVRVTRGGLPVTLVPVTGHGKVPVPPTDEPFWLASSTSGTLAWSPSAVRDHDLALVVMAPDGRGQVEVAATAGMRPHWLDPARWGLLILGTVDFLTGLVLLLWPRRRREIVYVVEPGQVPDLTARLGISTGPPAAALDGDAEPLGVLDPPEPDPPADPEPTEEDLVPGLAPAPPSGLVERPAWPAEADTVRAPAALAAPSWTGPTPIPTGVPGTYRSCSAPSQLTPSFGWPPVSAPTDGYVGSR